MYRLQLNGSVRDVPAMDYNPKDRYSELADTINKDNAFEHLPMLRAMNAMWLVKLWTQGGTPRRTSVEEKFNAILASTKRYYPVYHKRLFAAIDDLLMKAEADAAIYMYKNKLKYLNEGLYNINFIAYIMNTDVERQEDKPESFRKTEVRK